VIRGSGGPDEAVSYGAMVRAEHDVKITGDVSTGAFISAGDTVEISGHIDTAAEVYGPSLKMGENGVLELNTVTSADGSIVDGGAIVHVGQLSGGTVTMGSGGSSGDQWITPWKIPTSS